MPDNPQLPSDVEKNIATALGTTTTTSRKKKQPPSYKVVGSSKIPVAKSTGNVWKSRKDHALNITSDIIDAWDEALRYYSNDQMKYRNADTGETSGNLSNSQRLDDNWTETENVVFSNVSAMTPALYARNPRGEFTANDEDKKDFATLVEDIVNIIGSKQSSPGINLKPKAKRCVVTTLLTNRSWIKIGWTKKEDSSEKALADLAVLAKQLEKAKTQKAVIAAESEIHTLDETIDILQPSGPFAKYVHPKDVIIDPNAQEVDLSDAYWIMQSEYIPTQYIIAKYGNKKKGSTEVYSIYQPTHILRTGEKSTNGQDDENFSLFGNSDSAKTFGFDNDAAFEKAKMTKVWFIWDKVTRRVLMYNDKDWTWPIWVWDDPLQLDRFFPYYPLTFYESPNGLATKGEVTYYLDQQDAINEINDEERRGRRWAKRNIFFDKNVIGKADIDQVLNGPDGTARGLDLPQDTKIQDIIFSIIPPGLTHKELFDKESKYRAIDRLSSVGEVFRGAQFKTNTNKSAVQANVSAANMRVDEKSDQIEDWIGQIYWGIAQLCLMYMTKEQVAMLVGQKRAAAWVQMDPIEIRATFNVKVVGGSAKKPTSAAKKEEAMNIGQVLGQFINAAPGPVLTIMLKMFEQAFDEIIIKADDWKMIEDAIAQTQAQQQPQQGVQQQQDQSGQQQSQGQPDISQILSKIPPELKQSIAKLIQSGVPADQAIQQVMGQQPQQ